MKNFNITPLRIIFALLSVICMILIFCFSSENSDESSDTSGVFTNFAAEHFVSGYEQLSPEKQTDVLSEIDHIIRKCAHFSIYLILGFLLSCTAGKHRIFSLNTLIPLLTAFVYACTDEIHQYFVPGRSCQFTDVLIDTSGALTGILISVLIMNIINKIKKIQGG